MGQKARFGIITFLLTMANSFAGAAPPSLRERPYMAEAEIAIGRAGESEDDMLRGKVRSKVRFYVDGDNTRVDVIDPSAGTAHCEIYHAAAREKFLFDEGSTNVREYPVTLRNTDPIELLAHFAADGGTAIGTDAVGGDLCTKYQAVLANRQPVLVWVNLTTGMPEKIADGTTFVLLFSKFVYGPQDPSHFVPPGH